jgi:predicted HicB family RNase H-like nuclease
MVREDGKVHLVVRFDEALHRRLAEAAGESLRSLNNEIQWRVRASFQNDRKREAAG